MRAQICFAFDVSLNSVTGGGYTESFHPLSLSLNDDVEILKDAGALSEIAVVKGFGALAIPEIRLFLHQARKYGIVTPRFSFETAVRGRQNLS